GLKAKSVPRKPTKKKAASSAEDTACSNTEESTQTHTRTRKRAVEMAQCVRRLASQHQDLNLDLSTHTV
ncbi:hypothetical protein ACQP3C_30830, partial [Escherichia coli]